MRIFNPFSKAQKAVLFFVTKIASSLLSAMLQDGVVWHDDVSGRQLVLVTSGGLEGLEQRTGP